MGDRATVIFYGEPRRDQPYSPSQSVEISPTVYLQWCGGPEGVRDRLSELKVLMKDRAGDVSQICARFIGICHVHSCRSTGLRVFKNDLTEGTLFNQDALQQCSPGDAGVVLVDTNDFTWKAYHGYLAQSAKEDDEEEDVNELKARIMKMDQVIKGLEDQVLASPHWVLCEERYPDGTHESYWCQYHDGTRNHHNYTPGREKYTDSVWHPDFKLRNEEGLQSVKAWLEEPDRKGRSNA